MNFRIFVLHEEDTEEYRRKRFNLDIKTCKGFISKCKEEEFHPKPQVAAIQAVEVKHC